MRNSGFMLAKSYRNFALIFIVLSIILVVFAFYLIWAKVVITITPTEQTVSHEFVVEVRESDALHSLQDQSFVSGILKEVELISTDVFEASGDTTLISDVIGEVTIINNYSQDQTLVATTRLAAPNDPNTVLVRLKKTVIVPAGDQIKVTVYPDKPDQFTKLPPMRFIIPGLWGQLQDKIYAENEKELGETSQTIAVVTEDDLRDAEATLKEDLLQQAITNINEELEPQQTLWPKLVSSGRSEINYDAEVGDEVSEFSATMKLTAAIVVFDESQVITLAREKLKDSLSSDQQLVTIDPRSLSYLVEKYDSAAGFANVKVKVDGESILGQGSDLLNKDNLLGKTTDEVRTHFFQYPEIEAVDVEFFPSWLKKTPRIKDKIEIEIKS